LILRQSDRRC